MICLVFCSGWRCAGLAALGFSAFCQLANMHICVSSFIADTERQVLIYCSSNNCAGICPVLTGLRLENKSASLKIIVTRLSEQLFTGMGGGGSEIYFSDGFHCLCLENVCVTVINVCVTD